MKHIKILHITGKLVLSLCLLLMLFTSCTKELEDLNRDQKLISPEQLEADANEGGFALPGMQLGIIDALTTWRFEMQQNLNADNYSGYMGLPAPFIDNRNNATYAMVDSWNNQIWAVPSEKVLNQWVMMDKQGFETKYPDLYSLSVIFKCFAGHRLVDIFGPIPYSKYGTSTNVTFDSEEEAYNLFFDELREAVNILNDFENNDPTADQIRYAKFDKSLYGGNYATWIKVANTLRLRLAMRISNVSPAKAQTEAEAAVQGGVLTSNEGSFELPTGTIHPLVTITSAWQETRLNAAVESILKGYNDPRLTIYASPSTIPGLEGEIKGVRSGAAFGPGSNNYFSFSQVNFVDKPEVKVMDVAESYFLRAEGALRGWDMGGLAKDFYEEGIRVSFGSNGVGGVEDYLNDSTSTPIAYVDPSNPENNAPPISSITIQWQEGDSLERKLERIITQKWIAMYPEGQEAWSEFRRTGYPKLWPVVVNYSTDIAMGEFIKRIPYPTGITSASRQSVDEAVSKYLGGEDKANIQLWWDVD
ncbi:MAG: SusD/RagB family nutrient-binding outer membrane lipoprotein [Arenibacter algicola]